MRQQKKRLYNLVHATTLLRAQQFAVGNLVAARRSNRYLKYLLNAYLAIAIVPAAIPVNFSGPRLFIDTIDPTTIGAIYRFKDVSQLREIYTRLGLRPGPNGYYNIKHNKVHGEEAMLITFEKVFLGVRNFELQMKYHISHNVISQITEWFCDWIQRNWIYLIRGTRRYNSRSTFF
jgi:hypothetical protein